MKKFYKALGILIVTSLFAGCGNGTNTTSYDNIIAEYEQNIENLNKKYNDFVLEYNALMKERNALDEENAQLKANVEAYEAIVNEVNAEREKKNEEIRAKNEEENAKRIAWEEQWNSLTDAQRNAITEGKERADMVNALLYSNDEYARIYQYFIDLEKTGVTSFLNTSEEFKTYEANRKRKTEIENEYLATLKETDAN